MRQTPDVADLGADRVTENPEKPEVSQEMKDASADEQVPDPREWMLPDVLVVPKLATHMMNRSATSGAASCPTTPTPDCT